MTVASDTVVALLREVRQCYGDEEEAARAVDALIERHRSPLRVALTGMVKAGKSTLLNAIVGEEIAPTDAAECTRLITWYVYGATRRIFVHLRDGSVHRLAVVRTRGRLDIRLGGFDADSIERIVVEWPATALRGMTLIDTPGFASLSPDVVARSRRFLLPESGPSEADAVLYLLRHLHGVDLDLLTAFRRGADEPRSAVSAIAVLSRADEIGAGRLDALLSARNVAQRYREEGSLQELTLGILPVAGLLAQSATTLRQAEFQALQSLADMDRRARDRVLRSADLFVSSDEVPVPAPTRALLLDRLGMFGIKLALVLLRNGTPDATALSAELTRRSGLDELVRWIDELFADRAETLKIRAITSGVRAVLEARPVADREAIDALLEQLDVAVHESTELHLISVARTVGFTFPRRLAAEAERILGGHGTDERRRLALTDDADDAEILAAAVDAHRRWRAVQTHPMTSPDETQVAAAVARSCEAIILAHSSAHRVWRGAAVTPRSQSPLAGVAPTTAPAAASTSPAMSSARR
ncbi:dynamin family protein [Herbiconiux sp. L3-i23]|uniref:dynamin family protein n=1 Tax=Herbiconiux sp. L3-i23 TaxID=2905871 RepID=UPI002054091A|nr:dynamin family protein [Herbiconiux sp. L3-i23]BDI22351.1 isoniazid-inducible protein iniC [Herbiconiux sp. L3-i23]